MARAPQLLQYPNSERHETPTPDTVRQSVAKAKLENVPCNGGVKPRAMLSDIVIQSVANVEKKRACVAMNSENERPNTRD